MTTTETTPFDPARAEAFGERMVGVLNDACLALMTSIGHQTGLFDTMAGLPPSSSTEVAAAAQLHERYVREWLGAMATGRVVDYDPDNCTYHLPAEHAACLTRAAGPDNLGQTTWPRPCSSFPCWPPWRGPWSSASARAAACLPGYTEFHRLMAKDSAGVHDAALIDAILPVAPQLPERLEAGIDVADVGCGSGHALNLMAQAFPASRFTGYDFSDEAIAAGRREAESLGLANARFELRDVTELGVHEGYDLITAFDAIHDQAQPAAVLAGVARALRPGGVFLMVDLRASSNVEDNLVSHGRPVPLHGLHHALHDRVAGPRRCGPGHGVGPAAGHPDALRGRVRLGGGGPGEHDVFNDYFIARKG